MNEFQQPVPKIGVDELHYFPINSDSKEELDYGESVWVQGSVNIGFGFNSSVDVFDADNGAYAVTPVLGEQTVGIEGADFTTEMISEWIGADYEYGLMTFEEVKPKYFGIAWRVKKSDGSYRYIRAYKGMFSMPDQNAQTAVSGSVNYQTSSIEFKAVKSNFAGTTFSILDDNDPRLPDGVTPAVIKEQWFKDLSWKPEPVETYIVE